jgi:hypothetical protein
MLSLLKKATVEELITNLGQTAWCEEQILIELHERGAVPDGTFYLPVSSPAGCAKPKWRHFFKPV